MTRDLGIPEEAIDDVVDRALEEDSSGGDVTTEAVIPDGLMGKASITAKADGVMAGGAVASKVFNRVDASLITRQLIADGATLKPGDVVFTVSGRVASILKGERIALNLMSRLSGIATATARYVDAVKGLKAEIYDTRKTTPGMRLLEKYAVRAGGGRNHRLNMYDAVLIKDTHITASRALGLNLKDILAQARRNAPKGITVEIEVSNADEAREAVAGGADIIMLDNIAPDEMHRIREFIPQGIRTEASGGITLDNVRAVAESGVDIISIGALTHSPKAFDFGLELEPETIRLGDKK